jgi:hypothetical protein
MPFYRAAQPLSRQTFLMSPQSSAGTARIGSCWRKLNPRQQALLVLLHLRKGETFAELAVGLGVGTAMAWRYVTETTRLLAARASKLSRPCAARRGPGSRS